MIVREATLAQANGATLFCIGTELDQLTGPAYETYWDNIVSAVRWAAGPTSAPFS